MTRDRIVIAFTQESLPAELQVYDMMAEGTGQAPATRLL